MADKITAKNPAKVEFVGELLSASQLDSTEIVLLTLQSADDDTLTVSTSTNYWKKLGKLFPEGSICKISYEKRIANVTTYENTSKELVHHTADGNSLIGINRFSTSAWDRMIANHTKENDLAVISAVEVDRVSAVAQYLAAYVK